MECRRRQSYPTVFKYIGGKRSVKKTEETEGNPRNVVTGEVCKTKSEILHIIPALVDKGIYHAV